LTKQNDRTIFFVLFDGFVYCDKDSLNIIFQQLDLVSQLRLRATCRKLYIYDLYNINYNLKNKLTDKIILQSKTLYEKFVSFHHQS